MDVLSLEEKKKKIGLEKTRLEQKEKLLKEKERKIKISRFIKLGELISQVDLAAMEMPVLYGALLQIKEDSSDPLQIETWKAKGLKALQIEKSNSAQPLIVSFKTEPSDSIKKLLKDQKFKWNSFRNEWYGHGNEETLKTQLESSHALVEIAK